MFPFFVGETPLPKLGTELCGGKDDFCPRGFMSSELEPSEVATEPLEGGAGASGMGDCTSSLTEAKYPLFCVWRLDSFLKFANLESLGGASKEEPVEPDDTEGEESDSAETTDEGASGTGRLAFCGFFRAGMVW